MDVKVITEDVSAEILDRRAMPRCAVDADGMVMLVDYEFWMPCHILDVSLDGCRFRAAMHLPAKLLIRVELSFVLRGMPFRFNGLAQWTDGHNLAGVRFVAMPARRRDDFAEVLCEFEAEKAAAQEQAAKKLLVATAPVEEQVQRQAIEEPAALTNVEKTEQREPEAPPVAIEPDGRPARKSAKRDRRTQARFEVDDSARILLVNVGSWLDGRIQDLSLNGCRIRTEQRPLVGIYTRVETEFRLRGLPFRLAGVIQAVHDRVQVGIRFLDVSECKHAQLEELIEEIEEVHGLECPASGGAGKDPLQAE